jgi:hypothetical protein
MRQKPSFAVPPAASIPQRASRRSPTSVCAHRRIKASSKSPPPDSPAPRPSSLSVCHGTSCSQNGGNAALLDALRLLCNTADVRATSRPAVDACGCLGHCSNQGVNVGAIRDGGLPTVRVGVAAVSDMLKAVRSVGVPEGSMDLNVREALLAKEAGNALLNGGDADAAIAEYGNALGALQGLANLSAKGVNARDSYSAGILCNRSAAFASLKHFVEALDDANAAVDLLPQLSAAWQRKGNAEEGAGNIEAAASALEVAVRLEQVGPKRLALQKRVLQLQAPKKRWGLF